MSFKSNKSKLDFKVHYNFVYMSIFVCVCVYIHAFLCCCLFLHNWIWGSSKKVDYFSYNFNSSSALRLLHISTMLKTIGKHIDTTSTLRLGFSRMVEFLLVNISGRTAPFSPNPPLSGCCHDQREAFGTMENVHDFKLL